uniref:Uncharacterized protein n=1 Tax=Panagrolaimus sp. ES5 TaxID=591445 RepID=A0AC34GDJ8_9BILA
MQENIGVSSAASDSSLANLKTYLSTMSEDAPAAFYGAHILGRNSIRIFDASMDDSYDKEVPAELVPASWTLDAVQEHIKMLLNLLPRKLDC